MIPTPPKTRLHHVATEPDGPTVRATNWVFKNPPRRVPGARIDIDDRFLFIPADDIERVAVKLIEAHDAIREQAKR